MEITQHANDTEAANYCKAQDARGWDVSAERHADGTWTVTSTPFDNEDEEA